MQARPFSHLARIGATSVDHMLANDCALFGFNHPFARIILGDVRGAAMAKDLHAFLTRTSGHRHGHVRRVHMAIVWGVKRAQNAIQIIKRVLFCDEVRPDQLDIETQRTADGQGVAQPVHLILGVGQPERAAAMPGDRLPCLFLKRLGIEADVVIDHPPQPVGAGGMGDLPGRVPCRSAGQFGLFQQDRVFAPAFMPQMIGQATAHNAAANNDDLCALRQFFFGHHKFPVRESQISVDLIFKQMYHGQ